jgi:acetolactate synthase small subunit
MTILTDAEDDQVRLLEANLKKLVDVIFLEVSVDLKVISRELVLIKVPMRDDFSLPGDLVKRYGLRLLERSLESMVLEATGTQKEVHELLKLLHPLRPVEIARSGRVAIPRTGSAFYRLRLEGVRIAGKPQ